MGSSAHGQLGMQNLGAGTYSLIHDVNDVDESDNDFEEYVLRLCAIHNITAIDKDI